MTDQVSPSRVKLGNVNGFCGLALPWIGSDREEPQSESFSAEFTQIRGFERNRDFSPTTRQSLVSPGSCRISDRIKVWRVITACGRIFGEYQARIP